MCSVVVESCQWLGSVLPANVVNALFRLGLQAHPDVVFFPAEITHEFSTGTQHRYQRIANVTAANAAALTTMRHQLFDKPQAAFLFANDQHYTIVLTGCWRVES